MLKNTVNTNALAATSFLDTQMGGTNFVPRTKFVGQRLTNRKYVDMICDCCGGPTGDDGGDDCCGFVSESH